MNDSSKSTSAQPVASTSTGEELLSRRKIIISRAFKFAGQTTACVVVNRHVQLMPLRERIEVWDDSPEALEYFAAGGEPLDSLIEPDPQRGSATIDRGTATLGQGYEKRGKLLSTTASPSPGLSEEQSATEAASPADTPAAVKSVQPRPGPKKRAGGLASLKASLDRPATKLSTLEKSKLDWNRCVQAPFAELTST